VAQDLAASLAAGIVIGVERGWRERDLAEGGRVGDLRTFALVGLLLLVGRRARAVVARVRRMAAAGRHRPRVAAARGVAARGAATMALAAVVAAVPQNLKPTLHLGVEVDRTLRADRGLAVAHAVGR
jgi:hypothetical protein